MNVLSGVRVAFSGKMSKVRTDMEFEAHDLGAIPEERVTKSTNWLVVGDRPGKTKVNRAKQYGTRILTENAYRLEIGQRSAGAREQVEERVAVKKPDEVRNPVTLETPEWLKRLKSTAAVRF